MLTDMEKKNENALKVLMNEITLATLDMENEEASEFFSLLADWAYAQSEATLIDSDLELQDYDNEERRINH